MKRFARLMEDFNFTANAVSAEQRRKAIAKLNRRVRQFGLSMAVMILITLLLVWQQNIGAVCSGMLAALFYAGAVQLRCEVRALEVLDLVQKEREKRVS